MFERLYRGLGEDTPVSDFADGRLRAYFSDFQSYKVLGEKAAKKAKAEGARIEQITIERWTAQPPGSAAIEVATAQEAMRLADEMPGTWKHRRRGAYRVVPLGAKRPRRVQAEGWLVARRITRPWFLVKTAAAQTRNAYRDILSASFDHAVRGRKLKTNPLAEVKRSNRRHEANQIARALDPRQDGVAG